MTVFQFKLRRKSEGAVFLLLVAALAFVVVGIFVAWSISQLEDSQARIAKSANALQSAKSKVLDYIHLNGALPSIATFQTITAGITDNWGRSLLYFPASELLGGNVGTVTTTHISVFMCGGSRSCGTYDRIDNVPFLIVSPGEILYSTSSTIGQTTLLAASTTISTSEVFKVYDPGLDVGPYDDSMNAAKWKVFDDQLILTNLSEVYLASGTLSTTKGNVVDSGGDLKILNTNPLPQGTCGVAYTKTLTAYGKDTGTFTWSVTGLPTGITSAASSSKSVTVSGTPTVANTYAVVASITDPNARVASRNYSLTIVSPGWSDTGTTQSLSCATSYTGYYSGAISQKQQTDSCGQTQWITTSDTCAVVTATTDQQLTYNNLQSAITAAGGTLGNANTSVSSITVGSGTDGFRVTGSGNITRNNSGSNSTAIGVAGGASNYVNANESITFTLMSGYARTVGIVFRGFGVRTSGANRTEQAIVQLQNTLTGTTVASYTLSACTSETGTGTTQNSSFFLPDPGAVFDQIVVTAGNSPGTTDFLIRALKTCGVGSSCLPSGTTGTACPYP